MKGENLLETAGRFWRKNDLVRQNAAQGPGCGPEEKKTFSRKTGQNSKDLEKKSLSKNSKIKYQICKFKSRPRPIFPLNESRTSLFF